MQFFADTPDNDGILPESETLKIVARFAEPNERMAASRELARSLGAHDSIFFIRRVSDGEPVPAPGWPQDINNNHQWRHLLQRAGPDGISHGHLSRSHDQDDVPVTVVSSDAGSGVVLIGSHIVSTRLRVLHLSIPLIVAALTAERAAETAKSDAQEAERAREEFLSIASHELRTPLTTVKGYVQILSRTLNDPNARHDRLVRAADRLATETERIESLVADLLDVSRIRQGRLALRTEPMDLKQLAEQVLARFESAPEKMPDQVISLDAPYPVAGVWDPFRLDQVLSNLVSNALKYSTGNGNGNVEVVLRSERSHVTLTVRDQGMGISTAGKSRLFTPFYRDPQMEVRVGGTGLGLYISKQITESHGGSIEVDSIEGEGSTFTVTLPRTVD